jgi:alkanesulfonate monooxygenase
MQIIRRAWTSYEPFDYEGAHYRFADFVSDVFPVQQPRPRLSFGGSSPAAYRTGGAEADIYCLWGEPLASTAEQIESVQAAAQAAGRDDVPKIQVAFRPIIAATEKRPGRRRATSWAGSRTGSPRMAGRCRGAGR